jgi:cyclopropane fatty-acyl-phospholipid synthase-like methyltransferase
MAGIDHGWETRSATPALPGIDWHRQQLQRAFLRLMDRQVLGGKVLDIRCGSGELALELASRGLDVTGVDTDESAITRARTSACARRLNIQYHAADLSWRVAPLVGPFHVVLDTGLFHLLSERRRISLRSTLESFLVEGGRLYLLAAAIPGSPGPCRPMKWPELNSLFSRGWDVEAIENEVYELPETRVPANLVTIRRGQPDSRGPRLNRGAAR